MPQEDPIPNRELSEEYDWSTRTLRGETEVVYNDDRIHFSTGGVSLGKIGYIEEPEGVLTGDEEPVPLPPSYDHLEGFSGIEEDEYSFPNHVIEGGLRVLFADRYNRDRVEGYMVNRLPFNFPVIIISHEDGGAAMCVPTRH